jgi:hypothetical protein
MIALLPFALLFAFATADSVPSPNALAARSIEGNTIVSPTSPPTRIRVSSELPYVGRLTFRLKDVAEVERFVFASKGEGGRVRALFIAQFESLLPAASKGYSFAIEDTTRLGAHAYQTNTGRFNFEIATAAKPGFEADQTAAFLAQRGLKVQDDDFVAARYARITDATKRNELILFYYENAQERGVGRWKQIEEKRAAEIFADVERQARKRFEVLD